MKTITSILFTFMVLMTCSLHAQDETKYEIVTNKSTVGWEATKVTGAHNGVINVKRGYLLMKGNTLTGGTVFFDMKSIVNLDIEDHEDKAKLENHLKSADFFDANKYPESVFKAYKVTPITKEGSEYNYLLDGSLTIKGRTHPLKMPIKVEVKDDKVFFSGKADVDRTLYDIKYGSDKFFDNLGDQLIYDLFHLTFKMMAKLPEKK